MKHQDGTRPGAGRRRAIAMIVALFAALTLGATTQASPAPAASLNFCGLIPSTYAWSCSSEGLARWTYASARYNGGGEIDYMRVGLRYSTVEYTQAAYGNHFVSVCHYTPYNADGAAAQFENSGASHTIVGYVDDSPNHTGCV